MMSPEPGSAAARRRLARQLLGAEVAFNEARQRHELERPEASRETLNEARRWLKAIEAAPSGSAAGRAD